MSVSSMMPSYLAF